MDAIHRLLAYGAVAGIVIGIGWSLVLTVSPRRALPAFEWLQAAVVSVLIVGAASGLVLLFTGPPPAETLHFVYALVALAIIPLARSFLGPGSARRLGLLLSVAFVVLGAVVYRLFTTG